MATIPDSEDRPLASAPSDGAYSTLTVYSDELPIIQPMSERPEMPSRPGNREGMWQPELDHGNMPTPQVGRGTDDEQARFLGERVSSTGYDVNYAYAMLCIVGEYLR